jgi:hypothetical protein
MFDPLAFRLTVLALLFVFLFVRIERRLRAEEVREKEERARRASRLAQSPRAAWCSAIAARLERLRQNHLAALPSRPRHTFYRKGLIAAVRQMVASLSYFHRPRSEAEMRKQSS